MTCGYKYEPAPKNKPLEGKQAMLTVEEQQQAGLYIGRDNRVYRRTKGSLVADVPAELLGEAPTSLLYTDQIDRSLCPPLGQIRHLFDTFMGHYSREILVWIGRDRKDKAQWHYMVPKQEGTSGSVEYDDPDGTTAARLAAKAKWVGSIHTHPGNSAYPSSVDTDNWRKGDCTGFHFIVARDHSYYLCAVIGGVTWTIENGTLPEAIPCDFEVAGDLPLDQVLLEPKPKTYHFQSTTSYTGYDDGYIGGYKDNYRSRYVIDDDANELYDYDELGWWTKSGHFHTWESEGLPKESLAVRRSTSERLPLSKKAKKRLSRSREQFSLKFEKQQGSRIYTPRGGDSLTGDSFLETDLGDYQVDTEDAAIQAAASEALIEMLREAGCIELTQGNEGFAVVVVGGRGFVVPEMEMDTLLWDEREPLPVEHHWRGCIDLEKGGLSVHRA